SVHVASSSHPQPVGGGPCSFQDQLRTPPPPTARALTRVDIGATHVQYAAPIGRPSRHDVGRVDDEPAPLARSPRRRRPTSHDPPDAWPRRPAGRALRRRRGPAFASHGVPVPGYVIRRETVRTGRLPLRLIGRLVIRPS